MENSFERAVIELCDKETFDAFFEETGTALFEFYHLSGIGKVDIEIRVPKTTISPEGIDAKWVYYDSGKDVEEKPYECCNITIEGGTCKNLFYPYKGHTFTDKEKQQMDSIGRLLFTIETKLRYAGLFEDAMKHDMLTGAANTQSFLSHVNALIKEGKIAFYDGFYFNIRNFKYVNKISSMEEGDACIRQYAQKLMGMCVEGELIGRIGGDNFIALVKRERSKAFADTLSGVEILVHANNGDRMVKLGAIIGIYEIPNDVKAASEIMMPMSMAYQSAKQILHKDYVYYNEDMAQKIMDGQQVMVNFDEALAKNEFVIYLQPKIDMQTSKVCGAEALARWIHNGEVVPPAKFIPPLEKDGTICRLDFEMLRQTCKTLQNWKRLNIDPLKISVNLSRWHLMEPDTFEKILSIVSQYDFELSDLEFEITETVDNEEYDSMTRLLKDLRSKGFTTSIDDFGTGYSSLTMLKDFNLDVVKLDRAFISKIGDELEGNKDRVLVANVINMAKELEMQVLAEGVETEAQRDFLVSANCDMVQGFYYSKPLDVASFEKKYLGI